MCLKRHEFFLANELKLIFTFVPMKKVVSIFLAFVFSLSAIGVQVTMHHCMGKTAFIVFGLEFNKHCKCKHDSEKHNKKCCDKKSIVIKTVGDGFANYTKALSFEKICLNKFLIAESSLIDFSFYKNTIPLFISKAPPDRGVPLNTLNCVFRI